MILNNGQNMVQPSSGGGRSSGMIGRLADILMRNQNMAQMEESRKRIKTHEGKVKVETEKAIGDNRIKQGVKGRKAMQKLAFAELPDNHPDVLTGKSKKHEVTGRHYKDPILADQAMKGGINPDPKGQIIVGPVSAINLAQKVSDRKNPTKSARVKKGKNPTIKDTYEAYTSGNITKDQARDLNPKMDAHFKKKGITGNDTEEDVNKVNKNVGNTWEIK